jgi:hypothetical protein
LAVIRCQKLLIKTVVHLEHRSSGRGNMHVAANIT